MSISNPNITIPIIPANQAITPGPQRVLFVGQMLSGTATAGNLVNDVGNQGQEDALFGKKSMLAGAIRAFRKINAVTNVDVIPLADLTGGIAATGTIVFAGTSTLAGSLFVTIGSKANYLFEVDVTSGTAASSVATALANLINASTVCPFTATTASGTVTLTYAHAGTEGNFSNIRVEGTLPGITFTVSAFSGGSGNPVTSGIFGLVADTRYQTVVWPTGYSDGEVLTNFLDSRFNVVNDVLDGVAVKSFVGSYSQCAAYGNGFNDQNFMPVYAKTVADPTWQGNIGQELPFCIAAQVAAIRSLRLTAGSNLSNYVVTTVGSLDNQGGHALASFPYFNTPMPYIPIIPTGKGFSRSEVDGLKAAGGLVFGNNVTHNGVILGQASTTYKNDAAGNSDVTFKYLEYVDTAVTVREYFFVNLKKQYSQTRLTGGDLVPNRAIANAASIGSFLDGLYQDLASVDYVLTQAGEVPTNYFKTHRTVTLDLTTGTANIVMSVPIVVQLRVIYAPMQIVFNTQN